MAWVIFDAFFDIDIRVLSLAVGFVIIFAFFMFFLGRTSFLKKNPTMKTLISFAFSILCIYGIYNSRIDLSNIFYRIGFNENLIYNFLLIGLVLLFILVGFAKKTTSLGHRKRVWKLSRSLKIFGLLFVALGVTPLVQYSKLIVIGIGVGLYILGIIFTKKTKGLKIQII